MTGSPGNNHRDTLTHICVGRRFHFFAFDSSGVGGGGCEGVCAGGGGGVEKKKKTNEKKTGSKDAISKEVEKVEINVREEQTYQKSK